ncbi:hypothetical protein [Ekhidna sp.]
MKAFFFASLSLLVISIGIHISSILGNSIEEKYAFIWVMHIAAMAVYATYFFVLNEKNVKVKDKIEVLPDTIRYLLKAMSGYSIVLMFLLFYSSIFVTESIKLGDFTLAFDWENNLSKESFSLRLNGLSLFSGF